MMCPRRSEFPESVLWGLATVLAALCVALAPAGCAGIGLRGGAGRLTMVSTDSEWALTPDIRTAVYSTSDTAAADIYLSDLPLDRLTDLRDDLSGLSGSVLHIRLFIVPRAGNTPIGNTACNITLRHAILAASEPDAPPSVGVFGGGGFLLPSGKPGDRTIGGRVTEVTMRLLDSTDGFEDLFTTARVSGRFNASLNAEAAGALAARMRRLADEAAQR